MKAKPTLYELLGVPQAAVVPEIQAAYRREMNALEGRRAGMPPQEFSDRVQLLRLAYSTLTDPVSRTGYDNKLAASAAATPTAAATRALSLRAEPERPPVDPGAEARADALALRADALSLRADAMLLRAGLPAGGADAGGRALPAGVLGSAKRVVRALGLLLILGFVTFSLARCSLAGSQQRQAALQAEAAEKTALQEYYQTHGVRPANRAEMELMEAERRRKENEQRQAEQNRRKQEQEERRFQEESHRRGQEVSAELQRSEQQQRYQQLQDEQIKLREEQTRLAREQVQRERERLRQDQQRKQWQDTLRP